LKNPKGQKPP